MEVEGIFHEEEPKGAVLFGCEVGSSAVVVVVVGNALDVLVEVEVVHRSCSKLIREVARLENRNFRSRSYLKKKITLGSIHK